MQRHIGKHQRGISASGKGNWKEKDVENSKVGGHSGMRSKRERKGKEYIGAVLKCREPRKFSELRQAAPVVLLLSNGSIDAVGDN